MEWIPKLWDTFDSSVFSLRLAWPGYHGHVARNILKVGALGSIVIISPVVLGICIVALATYVFAELAYRTCIFVGGMVFAQIGR